MPSTSAVRSRWDRIDRHPDIAGWVLTPLGTVFLGPALAASVGILGITFGSLDTTPAVCAAVAAENGCEETTWRLLGWYGLLFAALWLAQFALPWWRGLRAARIGLAVAGCAVLIAAVLRLLESGQAA